MTSSDNSVRNRYLHEEILTASKEKLLLITYEIAIGSCRKAVKAIEAEDIQGANNEIQKAQRSIRELQLALRPEKAPELAEDLGRIYDFMYNELLLANLHKEPEKVTRIASMLEDLLESWKELFLKLKEDSSQGGRKENSRRELVGGGLNISG